MRTVDQSLIREFLDYNYDTGIFTWKPRNIKYFKDERAYKIWNTKWPGKEAGYQTSHGYIYIAIFNTKYNASTFAWIYLYGEIPSGYIVDHIDHIGINNKRGNLRLINIQENNHNQSLNRTNTSGYNGVGWNKKTNKYVAYIHINRRMIHLGFFESKEEAIAAREAANIFYNFHPNHGLKRA